MITSAETWSILNMFKIASVSLSLSYELFVVCYLAEKMKNKVIYIYNIQMRVRNPKCTDFCQCIDCSVEIIFCTPFKPNIS